MSLIACRACESLIFARERACPFCGAAVPRVRRGRSVAKIAAGALAGATAIFSGIGCAYGCPGGCTHYDAGRNDADIAEAGLGDGAVDARADAAEDAPDDVTEDAPDDVTEDAPDDASDAAAD